LHDRALPVRTLRHYLLYYSVTNISQALSSDNVLLALSALMCERPVLVTCSVRSLLSVAVSSLKALLHPLDWHHAYAPLLPAAEVIFLFCRFYVCPQHRHYSIEQNTVTLNEAAHEEVI
ncbi:unnamed protein product, partial [Ectocarpus sp. 8 AP-2014]